MQLFIKDWTFSNWKLLKYSFLTPFKKTESIERLKGLYEQLILLTVRAANFIKLILIWRIMIKKVNYLINIIIYFFLLVYLCKRVLLNYFPAERTFSV